MTARYNTTHGIYTPGMGESNRAVSIKMDPNLDFRRVLLSDPSTDRCRGFQPKHVSNPRIQCKPN